MQCDRRFVSDRTVWSNLVVVSTPFLHFSPCVVKAHEPVCVQTLGPELAVEPFDERIVRRLARPREVENDTAMIGPEIEIARDELRSLIYSDRLWIADLTADRL